MNQAGRTRVPECQSELNTRFKLLFIRVLIIRVILRTLRNQLCTPLDITNNSADLLDCWNSAWGVSAWEDLVSWRAAFYQRDLECAWLKANQIVSTASLTARSTSFVILSYLSISEGSRPSVRLLLEYITMCFCTFNHCDHEDIVCPAAIAISCKFYL